MKPATDNRATPKTTLKQQSIIRSATQLFLRHGYSHTTMDAIAQKARVTKQTVYSYYHDKDTLFVNMISDLCRRHAPRTLEDGGRSFEALLLEIGLAFLDLLTHADVLAATRLVIAESERHPMLAQLYYDSGTQRLVAMLAEFLDRQNARGVVRIPNTLSASSYFLSLLKGQYYLRMILRVKPLPSQKAKQDHVKETVAVFMRLYGEAEPLHTHSTL
jgi:TetR/AcrR family transcriptional repressor of mexJK operon